MPVQVIFTWDTAATNREPYSVLVELLEGCWSTNQFKTGPLSCPHDVSQYQIFDGSIV